MVLGPQWAVEDVSEYGSLLLFFLLDWYEGCNTGLTSFTFNARKILHKSWKGPKY